LPVLWVFTGLIEDSDVLGCDTVSLGEWLLTFRSNILRSFLRIKWSKKTKGCDLSKHQEPLTRLHNIMSQKTRILKFLFNCTLLCNYN
jgi:hypothetical protein